MAENAYLKWFATKTPAKYWYDGGVRTDQLEAFGNGANGMTTNPFLLQVGLNTCRDFWSEKLAALPKNLQGDDRAVALTKMVVGYYLDQVKPIFEKNVEWEGFVCAQTSPFHCGDADYMIAQMKEYAAWAPNICIKIPATKAGLEAYEEGAALGYNVVGTISCTVPQVIALAEAAERGKKRAKAAGIKPGLSAAVMMAGRLDDYLRDCAHDVRANLSESDITQAGIACMKKAYQIFEERKYSSWIMPAGLRGANQVYEMAGAKMVFSLAKMITNMIDPNAPQEERVNVPVADDVMNRLMKLPEFRKAYLEDGMKDTEFMTYGCNNRTIDQYTNVGWNLLMSYEY